MTIKKNEDFICWMDDGKTYCKSCVGDRKETAVPLIEEAIDEDVVIICDGNNCPLENSRIR